MKTRIVAACAAVWLAALPLRAQQTDPSPATPAAPAPGTPWTLADCIAHAQQNNTQVQQRQLQVERSDIELSTARYSRLPDLNASIGGDASFGRALTSDNTYRNNNQTSGSLNVSASMPLFQGMRINHQIKAGKLDLAAAIEDLERIREDVAINVMTLYLQVLYNKEMVGVAERQLELSTQQALRSRELAAAGKQPESAVYESEALAANDRMTLTQSRNDLQLALLDLSQALNRESAAGFDIVEPVLDSVALETLHNLGNPDAVYAYAAENRPHIRAEKLRLESSEHAVDVARSALYPTLSLSGGYGTGGIQCRRHEVLGPDAPQQPGVCRPVARYPDLQPPRHTQQHPHGAHRRTQPAAGRNGSRTRPAQGDRTGVVQRRRRLCQVPRGRRRLRLVRGGLQLRTGESRSRPLDRLRLQRRQDPHGEGRSRSRAGQIRIRLPLEDPRLLPRRTAPALTTVHTRAETPTRNSVPGSPLRFYPVRKRKAHFSGPKGGNPENLTYFCNDLQYATDGMA